MLVLSTYDRMEVLRMAREMVMDKYYQAQSNAMDTWMAGNKCSPAPLIPFPTATEVKEQAEALLKFVEG